MKIPRDISGKELAKLLSKLSYTITRQTGSHIRLTSSKQPEHHITIPAHKSLKIGTLNSILNDVAKHVELTREIVIEKLFGK